MDTLKEYSEIKYQISVLTKKAKELEMEATEEMEELEKQGLKPQFDFGTPYWTTRSKWEFSDKVKKLEKQLEVEIKKLEKEWDKKIFPIKDKEVHEGVAKKVETKSLSFRSK